MKANGKRFLLVVEKHSLHSVERMEIVATQTEMNCGFK